ncbi:hypothetical protein E2C01_066279 [Portunus trituberculatus]|uniref:Uncharacterized protein n=1 Tax=Portunus trituberculatus TaxID=210409 RepID=A0A5B7HRW8_PORTR|nr:hypothetical protein [Portunus trituberculatus]
MRCSSLFISVSSTQLVCVSETPLDRNTASSTDVITRQFTCRPPIR